MRIEDDVGYYMHNGQQIIVVVQGDDESISLFSAKNSKGKVTGHDVQLLQDIRSPGVTIRAAMNANYFVLASGMALGVRCGRDEWSVPRQDAWYYYAQKINGQTEIGMDNGFWYTDKEVRWACSPAMILMFHGNTMNLTSPAAAGTKDTPNTQSMLIRTDRNFALAVCRGRLTPEQCRSWARSIEGIQDLILMDSGGSSCLYADGEMLVKTNRKISDCIGFYTEAPQEGKTEDEKSMVETMKGIDVSNWQKALDIDKINYDFVIAKATEGTAYVDPYCDNFIQKARKAGKCYGFYHFARPSNDAVKEAEFFVSQTRNYFGEGIPVLDWEAEYKNNTAWALTWLNKVHELTGVRPLIYMSESVVNAYDWSTVVAGNYGLWVAKYRDNAPDYNYDMSNAGTRPQVKWWPFYAMWQWTSCGRLTGYDGSLDCDVFYGGKSVWEKYAAVESKTPVDPETDQSKEIAELKKEISDLEGMILTLKARADKAIRALKGEEEKS